jgi:ribosomal subunit interface protein
MKISLSGKHLDTGDALRAHLEKHLVHVVDKYFGDALEAHVTFSKVKHFFKTEISIHIGHDIYVRGEAEADEPYPSMDQAIHMIEGNLRRYKRRLRDHHKEGARESIEAKQYVLSGDYMNFGEEEETEDHAEATIVAETTKSLPTLTVSEAVMRMDLEGEDVLLFRNKKNGALNVVHMRPDGHIGWIDPHNG